MSGTQEAKDLLKKLNNMPVIFEESETGIRIVTSYESFKDAMYELNKQIVMTICAGFNDFLSCFKDEEIILPDNFDGDYLNCGWCAECMSYYEGPWVDYEPLTIKDDKELVFSFGFTPRFCSSFMECMGDDCYENER